MQVGIMSGHFQRPTLEESLDAILGHDIRHLQFNPGSVNVQGPLAAKLAKAPMGSRGDPKAGHDDFSGGRSGQHGGR